MMNDLISRDAAIDRIESHLRFGDELYPLTETDKILNYAFEVAASCVYNLPSAQPERKMGKWKHNESDDMFECSVCKYRNNSDPSKDTPYCLHCSVRMVRGDEMTSKEAAEYIGRYLVGDNTKWDKAMRLSYCALQKQIPRKPLQACGHATERWMNYCPICGQRIDWGGEENERS